MFSFSASSVDSHPPSSEMWPLRCAGGSRGGWMGRVYVKAAPLVWSQRGWIHAANATPDGTVCGVGAGRSRPASGRYLPLTLARTQPHPAASHPPLLCQRNGGRMSDFSPSALAAPRGSAREVAARDRVQCHPAGHPLAPFGAVDESQIRGDGTSFISERVRGGRRLGR